MPTTDSATVAAGTYSVTVDGQLLTFRDRRDYTHVIVGKVGDVWRVFGRTTIDPAPAARKVRERIARTWPTTGGEVRTIPVQPAA